ncbi:hypothetical protein [Lysobacter capsici]|uniref:hypothetical protein n=1 Tax=Lysobacter capsici TaxID=435897 RepID=UPI00398D5DB3
MRGRARCRSRERIGRRRNRDGARRGIGRRDDTRFAIDLGRLHARFDRDRLELERIGRGPGIVGPRVVLVAPQIVRIETDLGRGNRALPRARQAPLIGVVQLLETRRVIVGPGDPQQSGVSALDLRFVRVRRQPQPDERVHV